MQKKQQVKEQEQEQKAPTETLSFSLSALHVQTERKHPCRRHINRTNYVHTAAYSLPTIYNKFSSALSGCIVFVLTRRHTQFVSCIICLYYRICRNCLLTKMFVSRLFCRRRLLHLLVFLYFARTRNE